MLTRAAGAHTFLYRRTGGRIGRVIPGVRGRMLLLDHVGAKSGALRTTPLLFVEDGQDLLLIASKGGFPKHPAWYHNLMAHPDTTSRSARSDAPSTPGWPRSRSASASGLSPTPPTAATRTTAPGLTARSRWSCSSPARPRRDYSGRRSSATGSPSSVTIAGGGQGPAQLSRAPSRVIVVPEKKSPAGEAR